MKLKLIALILLPAALLPAALVTSCTADDELSGPVAVAPAHAVPLTLQLERQSPATYGDAPAATRSPRWDAVNNLQILIYSNNGT
ncbi:MAG: hypothetical protein LBL78_01730, partial [Prevotellaceae bacterium]|nr:hypothetical protein [Prevotellaceae bacterium]